MPLSYPRMLAAALLLAALVPQASAQITITRADVLAQLASSGTGSSFDLSDSTAFPALQTLADRSGVNQTWDFSSFPWTDQITASFAPATPPVPGSDSLSAATHIVAATQDDSTAYVFYDVTASEHRLLGVTAEIDDGGGGMMTVGVRFAPFDLLHPLPLTSTSTWSTSYDLEIIPSVDGFTTETVETSVVEGWGTLVTPAGSASVLKARTKFVTTTTIEIPGMDPIVSTDSSFSVDFISKAGIGASIFLDGDGAVIDATYSTLVGSGGGTAASDSPEDESGLGLAMAGPNPVRRGSAAEVHFGLSAPAEVRLEVFDALGRHVATLADGAYGAGPQRAALSTDGLPAGLYVVRLGAAGRTAALRLTVID